MWYVMTSLYFEGKNSFLCRDIRCSVPHDREVSNSLQFSTGRRKHHVCRDHPLSAHGGCHGCYLHGWNISGSCNDIASNFELAWRMG